MTSANVILRKYKQEAEMLAASKLMGFVPTRDSVKARTFYEDKLGFQFVSDDPFALVIKAGGTTIRIAKAKDFIPALHRHGMGSVRHRGRRQMAYRAGRGI